jgi:hypothetical protein
VLLGTDGSVSSSLTHTGTPSAAAFTITGAVGQTYSVTLPSSPVTLSSGSNSMTVDTFSASLGSLTGTIPGSGTVTFTVGARLNVGASQNPGDYAGTFQVNVVYN